uniref:Uncharacterized protein n=1 Tax=Lepeophtheirus salmonis TaxID=72036 RepID=A0A0K2VAH8_LEPSM
MKLFLLWVLQRTLQLILLYNLYLNDFFFL